MTSSFNFRNPAVCSVAPQLRSCIAKPIPEVILGLVTVFRLPSVKVQVSYQAINAVLAAFLLVKLGSTDPRADASVSLGKFLEINPFLQSYAIALG